MVKREYSQFGGLKANWNFVVKDIGVEEKWTGNWLCRKDYRIGCPRHEATAVVESCSACTDLTLKIELAVKNRLYNAPVRVLSFSGSFERHSADQFRMHISCRRLFAPIPQNPYLIVKPPNRLCFRLGTTNESFIIALRSWKCLNQCPKEVSFAFKPFLMTEWAPYFTSQKLSCGQTNVDWRPIMVHDFARVCIVATDL